MWVVKEGKIKEVKVEGAREEHGGWVEDWKAMADLKGGRQGVEEKQGWTEKRAEEETRVVEEGKEGKVVGAREGHGGWVEERAEEKEWVAEEGKVEGGKVGRVDQLWQPFPPNFQTWSPETAR
uniref:Uncharacterized protein n=1 Tax=Dunaliella tertiolecta TaxID=3047 RepID=A0A7S3R210_DUNTE